MGQRTDVKSPAILLLLAVCYESPWSPSTLAPIFMGSTTVWPEVRADGPAHMRAAVRLGLGLPSALTSFAPLVTLFALLLSPHIQPPSSLSPAQLDFHNKHGFLFQCLKHWLIKYSSAPLVRPCCPCHPWVSGALSQERTTSWTAVGRGQWLCLSHGAHRRREASSHSDWPLIPKLPGLSPGFCFVLFCMPQPYPPADLISHLPYYSELSLDKFPPSSIKLK